MPLSFRRRGMSNIDCGFANHPSSAPSIRCHAPYGCASLTSVGCVPSAPSSMDGLFGLSSNLSVSCVSLSRQPPSRHILHQNLPVPTRESVRAAPSLLSTLRGILFRVRPEASPIHTITKLTKKQKIRSATSDFYCISEVGDLIIWC